MKKYLYPILLPAVLWLGIFLMRPIYYNPWCQHLPTSCLIETVNAFDRVAFQFGSIQADFISNIVQNSIGLLTLLFPWLLYRHQKQLALKENLIFGKIALWNAVFLELTHAITQRPRPLVFHDPSHDGSNIHQYTSMYSGHTSFVALASLCLFYILNRYYLNHSHQKKPLILKFLFAHYLLITFSTGALRVLGGRHYPSDTLVGWIAGSVICIYFQKRQTQEFEKLT